MPKVYVLFVAAVIACAGSACAQRIVIPQQAAQALPDVVETFYQPQATISQNPLAPIPGSTAQLAQSPSTTLGAPRFDPYSTSPNAASQPPSLLSPSTGSPSTGSTVSGSPPSSFWQSPTTPGATVQPNFAQPVYPQTQSPVIQYPQSVPSPTYQTPGTAVIPGGYPQQPAVLFPNGLGLPNWNLPQAQQGPYLRLFQDIRFTYTWVNGGSGSDKLDTNDAELATTVNFPNFFFSGRPLHVSPGFVFHWWDGPDTDPVDFPTDLPSRVYSTYLNFGWRPMLTPQFGGEVDFNVGVFSDFDTTTFDSVRFQGTGLFVLGLTPTVALKGGVVYLDRVDLKLLPAGGIVWRPNPQTRFDIYFPKPKLAQYLTTIGNTDVWWYLNGEYGGGSWTVSRTGVGADRRMDVNDIRAGGGLEWTSQFGLRGFVEVAYVFNRELVFASGPIRQQDLEDTIMVRGGLAY